MAALRSNHAPGSLHWTIRRAEWGVLGVSEEDMAKPKIAVVNSSSGLAACFAHLDGVAGRVAAAIRAAGGVPFEIRTAAPSDFVVCAGHQGGYILASRDLVTNDIEVAVEGALLDGMVCLASCDKTVPGQLMAAARLDVPTLVVCCGYQPSGEFRGEHIDIEDLWLNIVHAQTGQASWTLEDLTEMSRNAILGPGVCAGMGTANSMHLACEALGMSLPGGAPVLANGEAMWRAVDAAGEAIVRLVEQDLRPSAILSPAAFENATKALLSASGSINCLKHLQAVAVEAGSDVDVYGLFERYADEVPLLAKVRPNGPDTIEDFEAAGGARGLLSQLRPLLREEALTVTGETLGAVLDAAPRVSGPAIRPLSDPFALHPSIVVVRGSLAPASGIVKRAVEDHRLLELTGPARVFDGAEAAMGVIQEGGIRPGDVVVVRSIGPRGRPGMGGASNVVFALDSLGLLDRIGVITDGQQSGLSNRGLVVNEVCPEAADGGPLALVEDGDLIAIDVPGRRVDLLVDGEVLATRRAALAPRPPSGERGWLGIYERLVRPLPEGAVLIQ